MYPEASPWIQKYQLKKDLSHTKFQVFFNDTITLLITKPGKLASAIGTTYLLCHFPPSKSDLILNFGCAGAEQETVKVSNGFICSKIVDEELDVHSYTDVFLSTLPEAEIHTCSQPMQTKDLTNNHTNSIITCDTNITTCDSIITDMDYSSILSEIETTNIDSTTSALIHFPKLYDMEASAFYSTAKLYFESEQIIIYKFCSDHLEETIPSAEYIQSLAKDHVEPIYDYIQNLSKLLINNDITIFSQSELELIEQVSQQLKLSTTMFFQLKQMMHFAKLSNIQIVPLLSELLISLEKTPCRSKKEGKQYLDELQAKLN